MKVEGNTALCAVLTTGGHGRALCGVQAIPRSLRDLRSRVRYCTAVYFSGLRDGRVVKASVLSAGGPWFKPRSGHTSD